MQLLKLAAAALALALSSTPALAQREIKDAPDPWVHAATGTKFPAQVGEFKRQRVTEYSEDGRDASAGYRIDRGDLSATVTFYVYPAYPAMTCTAVYEDAKSHIANYKGARLLGEGTSTAPSGRGLPVAFEARYNIPAGAMREDLPALDSELYLYCPPSGEWLVKYRASGSEGMDFHKQVETLMHAIAWPAKLGG
jgi:hypothetical protein